MSYCYREILLHSSKHVVGVEVSGDKRNRRNDVIFPRRQRLTFSGFDLETLDVRGRHGWPHLGGNHRF
jgi:hypothetical protein